MDQAKQAGGGMSFSMSMSNCPHCGNMMGYEAGKKVNCPHCGEEVDFS